MTEDPLKRTPMCELERDKVNQHADDQQRLFHYEATIERLGKERDDLYWHCKALLKLLLSLKTAPVATYAAAYLTQIVPPKESGNG